MAVSTERKVTTIKFTPYRQVSLEGFYKDKVGVECFVTEIAESRLKIVYLSGTTQYLSKDMFKGYNWTNVSRDTPKECHVICNDRTIGVFNHYEHARIFYDSLIKDFYNSAVKPEYRGDLVESHFSLIANDWGVIVNKEMWLNVKGEFSITEKPLKLFSSHNTKKGVKKK